VFSPARNDYRIDLTSKSRGFALLIMLAIILVAFTTIAISRLSHNSGEQQNRTRTTQALVQARDAIMAFTLSPTDPTRPPGILPCPDINGDGESDPLPNPGGVCNNRRGLVPFVTLNIPQPLDGTGAPIWYVVPIQYTEPVTAIYNSNNTNPSTLVLNQTQLMAFILLAPNDPLSAQVRTSRTPAVGLVAQFLEGENANSILDNNYSDLRNATQNDQVLGMPTGVFWTTVEARVLQEVRSIFETYHTNCGVYPYPADYSQTGTLTSNRSTSVATLEGRLPLVAALPVEWGAQCLPPFTANNAPAIPPAWIAAHWGDTLYYASCVAANCIRLEDISANPIFVSAIVIAPGVHLSTQPVRVAGNRNGFYELQNATPAPPNVFTQVKLSGHTGAFNDLVFIIR
jgi:hypothetical protein